MTGLIVTVEMFLTLSLPFQTGRAEEVFFEKKIRPVLVDHCFKCHGEKSQPPKGGLRLDTREGTAKGGANGPAILPGKPDKSLLLKVIRHDQGVEAMPPGKQLPKEVIADFTRWIALGAVDPRTNAPLVNASSSHWAFQPVKKTPVPPGEYSNEIDRFLLKKLREAGLNFSPSLPKRQLARRAYFDLHGLPPTPAEAAAFENNTSEGKWNQLVDRLLGSSRYGERWARHWLDVARYADNKGYVFFEEQSYPWAFTYRDYVINALNRDLPYNRFIEEQLAADQLPSDGKTLAAMGFLTVGGHFMNNTHDIMDDRLDVITRGLMGITLTCARCHDHKYDPISMGDYYGLYGVLRGATEPLVPPLYEPQVENESWRKTREDISTKEKALFDFVEGKHRALVEGGRKRAAEYLVAANKSKDKPADEDFMLLSDPGDLNPSMITRWRVFLQETKKNGDNAWVLWHLLADLPPAGFSKATDIFSQWAKEGNPVLRDAFTSPPKSIEELAQGYAKALQGVNEHGQEPCRKRRRVRIENPHEKELRQAFYGPKAPPDAPFALDWGFLSLFPERATQEAYKKLLKELETSCMKGPPRAMAVSKSTPYEPRIFLRGNPAHLGQSAEKKLLAIANPKAKRLSEEKDRLELARQIGSIENPLTARVIVNRVWLHHFGQGIVSTPDDFGTRGALPSHPELLDFLASEFMANGWSLKWLHRKIMTSNAYQQQSALKPDGVSKDSENKLLWRMNPRRLEFEPLHDSILAVSGSLDTRVGGPAGPLFSNRRAVYSTVNRLEFPIVLTTFDVPNPAASVGLRNATIVPPQALFLLNDPWVKSMAQKAGQQGTVNKKTAEEKVVALFEILLQRPPRPEELRRSANYLSQGNIPADLAHALILTNEFMFIE